MLEKLKQIAASKMADQNFDCLAVSVLNFNTSRFECFELTNKSVITSGEPSLFFDLASLTKPLTLASTFLKEPKLFSSDLELLLNHRGSLPEWGRLSKETWKEQISAYPIKKADVLYSDFSALRLMLELEKKSGKELKDLCSFFWDKALVHWKELPKNANTANSGSRKGQPIHGDVHDDNAFVLNQFCSHAGMFGTINGLSQSLLNLDSKSNLIDVMKKAMPKKGPDERYVNGWDTVSNPEDTLAGPGCGALTFGHLGFTGTSVWIDPEKGIGSVILSNATQKHWYSREQLKDLRQALGSAIWCQIPSANDALD
ncbi:MAG: serine hydrolase [Halobacteriovoraceae bacterium]|jgi:CubicO group peptidase (beta-lactamase class C family)|nr:serine hydrolase [Halobacteriovoraceae bacterium]MBT5092845.1 serine hydrolase [Halobacteriovoraceae bacterium]